MEHKCECGQLAKYQNKQGVWRCTKSSNSCPAVKEKKKLSCIRKYGVENISQIPEILEKKKKTWMAKYGVDNPSKAKENIDKIKKKWPVTESARKKTMLDKFGVDHYSKTDEFLARREETWKRKYGVDNPMKNVDICHKAIMANAKSEYRTRSMTLPSGKVIRYQGFEDIVIRELLDSGISEEDIVIGPGNVPHIQYSFSGKVHRYYPDIHIPKLNLLIEVKSQYTWEKYKDKNLAKQQACLDAGYEYKVEIRQRRKNDQ